MTFMDLQEPCYAYMFGFLQMDGHLSGRSGHKGRLSVELAHRDIELLRHFQRLTPYRSSVGTRTRSTNFAPRHTTALWTLCALEARDRLEELGLPYGRKSTTVTPPQVPYARRDYLRGVIDADGSVGRTSRGIPFLSLTTASTAIAITLRDYVRLVTGAERVLKRNTRDNIYNLLYTTECAVELAGHFYYSDCLALERKTRSAADAATWLRPANMRRSGPRRVWSAQEDRVLVASTGLEEAALVLGRSVQSCAMRLWRFRNGSLPLPEGDVSPGFSANGRA